MKIELDKEPVAMPEGRRNSAYADALNKLDEVGSSLLIRGPKLSSVRSVVRRHEAQGGGLFGKKFKCSAMDGGVRVWRVR